ncbi:hypothetical protein BKA67DRAFT_641222 [Truncatella angustata]|uniref:DUF202 domain-containing protein n=1 Tax=Truncatella angustata TaxID=152316 RepID=A0A9P8UXB7_9PEZI|nr:uncharacterized protein BKA67DRAFT_641222 [Truncatella angustata]KAH6660072.1 hypothetical protein BKA67DRAFT_641222 [Truncatella angustata]
MANEPPPNPGNDSSISKRASSQQKQAARPSNSVSPRRQSTQGRIDAILETGRERASSMRNASWSSGRSPNLQPVSQSPDHEDGPDERTGIFMRGNTRDYQATQVNTPPISGQTSTHALPSSAPATNGTANGHNANKEKNSWKQYLSGIWAIELENKGSVARDHLALERTFLAWLRTSLAFASIGIAVTQLFRLNTSLNSAPDDSSFQTIRHLGKPLGACFLGISILVLFLGYQRYVQSQHWIISKGKFPASRGTIVLVSAIAFALMVVSLIVVVVIQPAETSD